MNTELPNPIAAGAVVSDESHEYRGDAIKTWLDGAIANFHPLHGEVISLAPNGEHTVATARVSGTFPGSPVVLRYQFTLQGDKIAALSIDP